MDFTVEDICGMLKEYEADYQTGMDFVSIAEQLQGVIQAVKLFLSEQNTLFDNMKKKLLDYPNLCDMLQEILYNGRKIPYNVDNLEIDLVSRFGFIRNDNDVVKVSNRIFETRLYNYYATEEVIKSLLKQ